MEHSLFQQDYPEQPVFKRKTPLSEGDLAVTKKLRGVVDLTAEETITPIIHAYEKRQAIQDTVQEANLRQYQVIQEDIDAFCLGNGTNQHRNKTDLISTKLAVWKANKQNLASMRQPRQQQSQQTVAPAPPLAQDSAVAA
jgi:hypothetical protein